MTLDNKNQKELLLNIIQAFVLHGDYQQIKQALSIIDALLAAVANADVKQAEEAAEK